MAIHEEVLRAARRLGSERGDWRFSPEEIVCALPHLNAQSVRTHVGSRCCVNAPKNHPHRWAYFRRVGRGLYQVEPAYRKGERSAAGSGVSQVAEAGPRYGPRSRVVRDTIHAVVHRDDGFYVAECLEVSVVTQGRTADEVIANLREAIALHLEGEDPASLGLTRAPRLLITYEIPALDARRA